MAGPKKPRFSGLTPSNGRRMEGGTMCIYYVQLAVQNVFTSYRSPPPPPEKIETI
jgi:hypothetical protein